MMTRSEQLFALAQQLIPGGVNSPVCAFGSVVAVGLVMFVIVRYYSGSKGLFHKRCGRKPIH